MFDCSTSTLRYVVKKEGSDLQVKVDSPAMVSDAFVAPSGLLVGPLGQMLGLLQACGSSRGRAPRRRGPRNEVARDDGAYRSASASPAFRRSRIHLPAEPSAAAGVSAAPLRNRSQRLAGGLETFACLVAGLRNRLARQEQIERSNGQNPVILPKSRPIARKLRISS
jgi:hypothetical protein